MYERYQNVHCVVYTGDNTASEDEIFKTAADRWVSEEEGERRESGCIIFHLGYSPNFLPKIWMQAGQNKTDPRLSQQTRMGRSCPLPSIYLTSSEPRLTSAWG